MIFVGDISLPNNDLISLIDLPPTLLRSNWIGNLEGGIVDVSEDFVDKWCVFNTRSAIGELVQRFNFKGFLLANNHILDTANFESTLNYLSDLNIPYTGLGGNLDFAAKPMTISENGKEIIILNFGWSVIQCEVATRNRPGVNPFEKTHVVETFLAVKSRFPNAKIVVFFHWNYELESYPQPRERQIAKYLIDNGADAIIGAHPHRIGGFEVYNGKPIIYSLGNWMFVQNYYHKGKIAFPDFCNQELAFEIDFSSNKFAFHFFEFDKKNTKLRYTHTETGPDSPTMLEYTPFRSMTNREYKKWYKINRFHRNKGLPIYYWEDTGFTINLKNLINKVRDGLIYIAVNLGLK